MKNVVIVHKQFLVRAGLESLLKEMPFFPEVKSYSGDEPRLSRLILKHKPDLLIIHPASLSPENTALPRKARAAGKVKLLALAADHSDGQVFAAYDDVLMPDDSKFALENKINALAGAFRKQEAEREKLSQREITVLKLIVQGFTHQQIADKLFLSIHTVNTHRKNINRKLGIKTVSGLSVYAIMNHLIAMEDLSEKK